VNCDPSFCDPLFVTLNFPFVTLAFCDLASCDLCDQLFLENKNVPQMNRSVKLSNFGVGQYLDDALEEISKDHIAYMPGILEKKVIRSLISDHL